MGSCLLIYRKHWAVNGELIFRSKLNDVAKLIFPSVIRTIYDAFEGHTRTLTVWLVLGRSRL